MVNKNFHLAFPVDDLKKTRNFYVEILGCEEGRSSSTWIDFNLGGNQITAHLKVDECALLQNSSGDGDNVPVRHFGLILEWEEWNSYCTKLKHHKINFLIKPRVRFKGLKSEQSIMFFFDPSGNALEFKSFKYPENIFIKDKIY